VRKRRDAASKIDYTPKKRMNFSLESGKRALVLRYFFSGLPLAKIPGPTATALVCDSSFSFRSLRVVAIPNKNNSTILTRRSVL
jgi:hypothetical protein